MGGKTDKFTSLVHWVKHPIHGGESPVEDPEYEDEIVDVILLMGKTGVGKSTFINLLGGKNSETGEPPSVNNGIISCTSEVTQFAVEHNLGKIFLIDTPGFDDTGKSDTEILRMILNHIYLFNKHPGMKLVGVIYLHDISETKFSGSQQVTFNICEKLCGGAMKNVIVGTTKWASEGSEEHSAQVSREMQIRDKFWGNISKTCPLSKGDTNGPRNIITQLLSQPHIELCAQTELSRMTKRDNLLESTTAGRFVLSRHETRATKKSSNAGVVFDYREFTKSFVYIPETLVGFPKQALMALIFLVRWLRK